MGNDTIGYFFIILLVLIAAPLVFWILSVLYAWVKWLFNDKKKLNESYSFIQEIQNPIKDKFVMNYKIGTESQVDIFITDTKFNELKNLFSERQEVGKHSFTLDTNQLGNGKYFLKLQTKNQTLTKQIIIEN